MNISIYKIEDGVYEFTGVRTDGETVTGTLDGTQTVDQLTGLLDETKTKKEIEEKLRAGDMETKQALAELFELVLSMTDQEA